MLRCAAAMASASPIVSLTKPDFRFSRRVLCAGAVVGEERRRDSPAVVGIYFGGVEGPLNAPRRIFSRRRWSSFMAKIIKRYKRGNVPVQEATRCIFCGAPHLNWEHVYSRWTHRFLPPRRMKKYVVSHVDSHLDRSDRILVRRVGDIRDWQIKCVCEQTCNNGWMRRLENQARRIMIPLIEGTSLLKGDTVRLTPHDQQIIATWAVLKAMVSEFDPQGWVTTHHLQRRFMKERLRPPEGWVVWIGPYLRVKWVPHFLSFPFLYLSPKQELRRGSNIRATYYNSHITTQIIDKMFIQVIRSPARNFVSRWRFTLPHKGSLFRIWPPTGVSIMWPGQFMTDRDADYTAGAMYSFIMDRLAGVIRSTIEGPSAPSPTLPE